MHINRTLSMGSSANLAEAPTLTSSAALLALLDTADPGTDLCGTQSTTCNHYPQSPAVQPAVCNCPVGFPYRLLLNPCWLFTMTFLSFMSPEMCFKATQRFFQWKEVRLDCLFGLFLKTGATSAFPRCWGPTLICRTFQRWIRVTSKHHQLSQHLGCRPSGLRIQATRLDLHPLLLVLHLPEPCP